MTLSIGVFVLIGSLALLLGFQHQTEREERHAFEAQARANVAFLDRTPLPQSGQMAAQLGEIMGARVFFWHETTSSLVGKTGDTVDADVVKMPLDGHVHAMPSGEWVIGRSYRNSSRVFFLRPPPDNIVALNRADTWSALIAFWLLSLALGLWLARQVTRPLQTLARAVTFVGTEQTLPAIPTQRHDEIGQLAQALQHTHDTLRDERERRRAAERHALLGRMATSLAHEVRNPVAAIRLHAQLLEGAPADEAAASRQLIESEAARIESLVSQWMSYAKPAPPALTEVNAGDLVQQAVQIMEPQARHAGVSLQITTGETCFLQADRQRLLQVLTNLLLNAIQAMPHGGVVKAIIEPQASHIVIRIEDEGTGFSDTAMAKLGEPFYSEKEGGMGLGLAVAQDICEAHGGSLRVSNRSSASGAIVTLTLPRNPPRPS